MIIPSGYAQLNFIFTGTGLPTGAEVTMGVRIDGAIDTAVEIAVASFDIWATRMMPTMSTVTQLSAVKAKLGPNSTGPFAIETGDADGALSAAALLPNTAVLIHKNTLLGGRAGRGRMYVPGLTEGDVNADGIVTGTRVAAFQAAIELLHTDFQAIDLDPVLLHSETSSSDDTPTVIQSWSVDARAATQRRRLRR